VVCYFILFAIQLIAYFSTHVLVLFAQAFETLSDVLIASVLLLVTYWSRKPADEGHAFGHERAQYIAAIMAATLLIAVFSVESIRRGIEALQHRTGHVHHAGVALAITVIGMVIVALPIFVLAREKSEAATAKTQLVSVARDEIAYAIAVVAVVLAIKDVWWADPVGSIIVGVMIAFAAVYLFLENYSFLIGKSPGRKTLESLREAALSAPGVMNVHDLKVEHIGPSALHVDMHIAVEPSISIEDADNVAHAVVVKLMPLTHSEHASIHVDPYEAE